VHPLTEQGIHDTIDRIKRRIQDAEKLRRDIQDELKALKEK
jgi:prefoldin subunit 5